MNKPSGGVDLFFKAIYRKKYFGSFEFGSKFVRVSSYNNADDTRVVSVDKCNVYRNTGAVDKTDNPLFENDIVSNPRGDKLGIIIFKDCRYMIKFSRTSYIVLSERYASRCLLFAQATMETRSMINKKKAAAQSYSRENEPGRGS